MRKEAIIKAAIWVVYTCIIGIIFFNVGYSNALGHVGAPTERHPETVEPAPVSEVAVMPKPKFEIRESEGKIAVYQGETLIRLTEINVSSLRREDENRIRKGIVVESIEEVQQILEDYSS